ncbi:hypothetical protein BpHYR1_029581 [Brachionus plicatilis]|uniref:Uncharacterized protein n=1 Tax=Brachionus plicatilis TaxID=10195 RepID=A0A3M7RMV2_BRAPC|nr:hypothetical protein BpHYR1_029581 [Brachionus plicatilis]
MISTTIKTVRLMDRAKFTIYVSMVQQRIYIEFLFEIHNTNRWEICMCLCDISFFFNLLY